jgi:pectinesterase
MNRTLSAILLFLVIPGLFAAEKKKGILFTVTNPTAVVRTMEVVSIDLNGIYLYHPEWKNEVLTIFTANTEHTSQSIDNDQDGIDDELIFQATFKPNESRQFELYRKPAASVPVKSVVDVRYVLPREDVGWENDRIAFRVYGSVLAGNVDNGIDVWTKRVRYPVVAKWYQQSEGSLPGKDTYHHDTGEGADFFSVGRSLGAGSAGILWKGTLVQPGLFSHYRIITNGPIRTSFELFYTGMRLDTSRYTVIKRITLDAGVQLNRVEEEYISNAPNKTLTLAAGLVKRANTTISQNTDLRYLALWGSTNADSVNGSLGTAVVIPGTSTITFSEDAQQYRISTDIDQGKRTTYYSGAAWSRMGDIATEKEWLQYLDGFVQAKKNPLIITMKY